MLPLPWTMDTDGRALALQIPMQQRRKRRGKASYWME
jgi:hypothetical protein